MCTITLLIRQESCAIAKMTAQCALYMVPWKFSGLPDYAHGYYSQHFSWAFVPIHPMNVPSKFEVRSFTHSWNNRGYPKILGSPWIRPRSIFSKIFNGFLFGLALWMYPPHLKSVALLVPEIIGGTPKIWALTGYARAPPSPKFLTGFYSDWPCKCTCQIWSP